MSTAIRTLKKRWSVCRNNCAAESISPKNRSRVRISRVTTNRKSDKERAFLQDLFVAPDWGERFSELIDEHVKIPNEGKALYIEAGTRGQAIPPKEPRGKKTQLP